MTKRSTTIILASIAAVAVFSVFSVGFAKWALVETDSTEVGGNIVVENVDTSSVYKFDGNPVVDHAICFGRPTDEQIASYGISNPWLTVTGEKYEVLSTFIDIKVIGLTNVNYKNILEIGAVTETSGKYASAYASGLVGSLPAPTTNQLTYIGGNAVRLTINFTWGSAFNYENPYKYYNSQTQTAVVENDAFSKLTSLKNLLNGVNYKIVLGTKTN